MVKVSDAPGLKRKPNADGSVRFYWEARRDAVLAGYEPKLVRLHYPETPEGFEQCKARCCILQAEMLAWLANGGSFPQRRHDGSMRSILDLFETDDLAPYRKKYKWNTQRTTSQCLKIIRETVGARQIRMLTGHDFVRWHEKWGEPKEPGGAPRPFRAKHCMDTVRAVIAYGVTMRYRDCIDADAILSKMKFEKPPARSAKLTREQVEAIRIKAHELGLGSIAFATLLQFELAFRQKDVIGEWLPDAEGQGGIRHNGTVWANGLTWSHIDSDLVLRKQHVKTKIWAEHDLRLYPDTLMAEIAKIPAERRVGPVILSEATGEPYKHRTFTVTWRRVADAAGIPRSVWNMDARSGAISEAYELGAAEPDVMKHAGHLSPQTHHKYNRGSLPQTSRIAVLRRQKQDGNKP